jgi:hypothetical protein
MAAMGKLIEDGMKAGWLIETHGLVPLGMGGARVRNSNGNLALVDGPFAEAKEVIGGFGFALLQADSREEAIGLVKKFLSIAGEGECDLLPFAEQPGR